MDVVAGVLLAGGEDGAGPGVHVGYGGGETGCEACSGAGPSVGCDVMQDPVLRLVPRRGVTSFAHPSRQEAQV